MSIQTHAAARHGATVLLLLLVLAAGVFAVSAHAEAREKHALVIANWDYLRASADLDNPKHDADLVASSLTAKGFEVERHDNLGRRDLFNAVRAFAKRMRGTDNVAVVYYSGHGAKVGERNYIIPTDAQLQDKGEAELEALSLRDILNLLEREVTDEERANGVYQRGLNVVILDACRNNPYPGRGLDGGLAKEQAGTGTLIWYATRPNERALDNIPGSTRRNGPFAVALADAMQKPGLDAQELFSEIKLATLDLTKGEQEPWMEGSVLGQFQFTPGSSGRSDDLLARFDPSLDGGDKSWFRHGDWWYGTVKEVPDQMQLWQRVRFRNSWPDGPETPYDFLVGVSMNVRSEAQIEIIALNFPRKCTIFQLLADFKNRDGTFSVRLLRWPLDHSRKERFRFALEELYAGSVTDGRNLSLRCVFGHVSKKPVINYELDMGLDFGFLGRKVKREYNLSGLQKQSREDMLEAAFKFSMNAPEDERIHYLREFIRKFPDSPRLEQAKTEIGKLGQRDRCGEAVSAWNYLKESTDVALLGRFMEEHADCPQAALAKERILTISN